MASTCGCVVLASLIVELVWIDCPAEQSERRCTCRDPAPPLVRLRLPLPLTGPKGVAHGSVTMDEGEGERTNWTPPILTGVVPRRLRLRSWLVVDGVTPPPVAVVGPVGIGPDPYLTNK